MASSNPIITLPSSLTIRPYRSSDAQPLAELANNRKIWQNMTDRFPHPYTIESSTWWIAYCSDAKNFLSIEKGSNNDGDTSDAVPSDYAVCLDDRPIGGCGLQYNPQSPRTMTLGYWLGEPYWGKGHGTAVATALSSWIFETFSWVARIDADAYSWNQGSQKVLLKAGFLLEGRQKFKACKDGKFGDLILFGKVRPGFQPKLFITDAP